MAVVERCWRCSAEMKWIHGTWQCPRCRFKLGCCEGEPQSCDAKRPRASWPTTWSASSPSSGSGSRR